MVKKDQPEAQGRRERKRAETLEKLFQAALELFARHGFADTRVEEITEKADVAKGTFFNYFPSKEHILMQLGKRQVGKVERCLELAREGKEPIESLLHSLARELTSLPGRSPQLARSVIAAFLSNAEVRKVMHEEMAMRGRKVLAEILKIGQQRGEIRRDMDAMEMARSFQQGMFGTVLLWSVIPRDPLNKLVDGMVDVLVSGLSS